MWNTPPKVTNWVPSAPPGRAMKMATLAEAITKMACDYYGVVSFEDLPDKARREIVAACLMTGISGARAFSMEPADLFQIINLILSKQYSDIEVVKIDNKKEADDFLEKHIDKIVGGFSFDRPVDKLVKVKKKAEPEKDAENA